MKTKQCNRCSKDFQAKDQRITKCKQCREDVFTKSSYWLWFMRLANRTPYKKAFEHTDHNELVSLYEDQKKFKSYRSVSVDGDWSEQTFILVQGLPLELDHAFPANSRKTHFIGECSARNLMIMPASTNKAKSDKILQDWGYKVDVRRQQKMNPQELERWLLKHTNVEDVRGRYQKAVPTTELESEWQKAQFTLVDVLRSENTRLGLELPETVLQTDNTALDFYQGLITKNGRDYLKFTQQVESITNLYEWLRFKLKDVLELVDGKHVFTVPYNKRDTVVIPVLDEYQAKTDFTYSKDDAFKAELLLALDAVLALEHDYKHTKLETINLKGKNIKAKPIPFLKAFGAATSQVGVEYHKPVSLTEVQALKANPLNGFSLF